MEARKQRIDRCMKHLLEKLSSINYPRFDLQIDILYIVPILSPSNHSTRPIIDHSLCPLITPSDNEHPLSIPLIRFLLSSLELSHESVGSGLLVDQLACSEKFVRFSSAHETSQSPPSLSFLSGIHHFFSPVFIDIHTQSCSHFDHSSSLHTIR